MDIVCKFNQFQYITGVSSYRCLVKSATISKSQLEINSFDGDHENDKSNKDVECFYCESSTIERIPRGLFKFFGNLRLLRFDYCGLREISRVDLIGLDQLRILQLNYNNLILLPDDLFINKPKLRDIQFAGNKIYFMSSKLLEPIQNHVDNINFQQNALIDDYFVKNSHGSLKQIMAKIDLNCLPLSRAQKEVLNNATMKVNGVLCDFIIVVEAEKFNVHKCVLANNSPVFNAMFSEDYEEGRSGQMTIEDFSADAVKGLLDYFYTGTAPDKKIATELFGLSIKYDVPNLKIQCEDIILELIEDLNAIETLDVLHLNTSDILKKMVFFKIEKMFPEGKLKESIMDDSDALNKLFNSKRAFDEVLKMYADA